MIRRLFLFSALCSLCAIAVVPASGQVSDELAAAYIDAVELDRSTLAFANQFRQLVLMQANQFPEPAATAYREEFEAALSDENIRARLHAFIAGNADPAGLRSAMEWRTDPEIAPLMERLDAASGDPRAQVSVQMYASSGRLGRHPVPPAREALARRYVEVTGTGAASVDLMADLVVTSNQISARLLQSELPPEDVLRAEVARQFAAEGTTPIRGFFLYAFHEAPDEEVIAFVDASNTDAARQYSRLSGDATSYAVVGAISAAGQAFLDRLSGLNAAGKFDLEAWREATRAQMQGARSGAGDRPEQVVPPDDDH